MPDIRKRRFKEFSQWNGRRTGYKRDRYKRLIAPKNSVDSPLGKGTRRHTKKYAFVRRVSMLLNHETPVYVNRKSISDCQIMLKVLIEKTLSLRDLFPLRYQTTQDTTPEKKIEFNSP